MISFLIGEIRSAAAWTKEIVLLFSKLMIRWMLRFGMMGMFFFVIGKGCSYASAVIASRINAGNVPMQQSAVTPPPSQPYFSQEAMRNPVNPMPVESKSQEIRSAWSTLRYVGQDLMRWFRKK